MSKIKIGLTQLHCIEQTDDTSTDSDEPYVLVFSGQIVSIGGLVKVPTAGTVLYGPWGDGDDGGRGKAKNPKFFWGLDGKHQEMWKVDDARLLVARNGEDGTR